MMARWTRYLPYALVVWLSRRSLERVNHATNTTTHAVIIFKGEVYSWVEKDSTHA
jgi:hypothetical protein